MKAVDGHTAVLCGLKFIVWVGLVWFLLVLKVGG